MSLDNIITAIFKPHRQIGSITAQVTIDEHHIDDLVITEHPVESGAVITDHSFKRPPSVTIKCAWSNSGFSALTAQVSNLIQAFLGTSQVGLGTFNQSQAVYQQLLALQESRIPFDLSTGKRNYKNMLIRSLAVDTDQQTEGALFVTLVCQQIIIVQTQTVILTPSADMKNPQKTAQTQSAGVKQAVPAVPSPGGASPPAGNANALPWSTAVSI